MSLDQRLDTARDEYRNLSAPVGATTLPRRAPDEGRSPWVLSVAALVVLLLIAATLVWRSVSSDPRPPVSVTTDTVVTVPVPDEPPATGDTAPLDVDPDLQLDHGGPYLDGQEVVLSSPNGFSLDWTNEYPRLCSVVTTPAGPTTSCDHVRDINARPGYAGVSTSPAGDRREIVLRRTVFTPVGYRDCNEPDVSCHVVVARADGSAAATERLEFEGSTRSTDAALEVRRGDGPGRFVVVPQGLQPSDAWLEARDRGLTQGMPAFTVSVCAFGGADPTLDPYGRPWQGPGLQLQWSLRPGLGANCDSLGGGVAQIDPDDPGRTLTVDLTRELYGSAGFSDCRVQACYLAVTQWTSRDGATLEAGVTLAARLPVEASTPITGRPSLTILEPGPYDQGQEITVEVANVPDAKIGMIGVCRLDSPWECLYADQSLGAGSGLRRFALVADLWGCGRELCFLALESGGEGLRPAAVTPLPVTDAASAGSG